MALRGDHKKHSSTQVKVMWYQGVAVQNGVSSLVGSGLIRSDWYSHLPNLFSIKTPLNERSNFIMKQRQFYPFMLPVKLLKHFIETHSLRLWQGVAETHWVKLKWRQHQQSLLVTSDGDETSRCSNTTTTTPFFWGGGQKKCKRPLFSVKTVGKTR